MINYTHNYNYRLDSYCLIVHFQLTSKSEPGMEQIQIQQV